MAKKSNVSEPTGLQIGTLSALFESSRNIELLIPMAKTGTTQLLAKQLIAITKDKDRLTTLFVSLERMQQAAATLGDTTLVAPTNHPLVERRHLPREEGLSAVRR